VGLCEDIAKEARRISGNGGEVRPEELPPATLSLGAVYETLRLYPSAYWLSREAKQVVEFAGTKPAAARLSS
jgi:cytochrome P450